MRETGHRIQIKLKHVFGDPDGGFSVVYTKRNNLGTNARARMPHNRKAVVQSHPKTNPAQFRGRTPTARTDPTRMDLSRDKSGETYFSVWKHVKRATSGFSKKEFENSTKNNKMVACQSKT